jgi:hypothetical protein
MSESDCFRLNVKLGKLNIAYQLSSVMKGEHASKYYYYQEPFFLFNNDVIDPIYIALKMVRCQIN